MMKFMAFASRNQKEIIREPLSIVFGLIFPIVLLTIFSILNNSLSNMPVQIFTIKSITPGMAVFSLSFISLFLGTLIASDRSTSFLPRLFSSPLKEEDYILGYSLPMLWVSIMQGVVCFGAALFFGLNFDAKVLLALLLLIPISFLYTALGLFLGTFCSPAQVGGMGSILINVSVLLSGTFFDLDSIGGGFKKFCYTLPFAHAVTVIKDVFKENYSDILMHLAWVLGYAIVIYAISVVFFGKRMRN